MTRERELNLDVLRVIATMAVIILHVDGKIWYTQLGVDNDRWIVANFFDGFARWSVPVFFMLSGYFILGKEIEVPKFYKKRLLRIVLPLLFWSICYMVGDTLIRNKDIY